MNKILFFILLLVGVLWTQTIVSASTYTVCAGLSCSAETITGALTLVNIAGGDTIQVQSGYDPSAETYPISFPAASTTLACDSGATISQTNSAALSAVINLSTSSTVRGCTFGQVILQSALASMVEPSGIRIEDNTFSTSATSSIYMYGGGTNFVIQNNRDINYLTFDGSKIVDNGLIQNNTFYGRMGSGFSGYMLAMNASSSRISIYNNLFESHTDSVSGANAALFVTGSDITFATNTLQYASASPSLSSSIVFSASGTNYIIGNKIQSPLTSNCSAVAIYPSMGVVGLITMDYVFHHNTIEVKCGGGSQSGLAIDDASNSSVTINVTTTNSLFYSGGSTRAISLNKATGGSIINFSNDWNGFYGFTDPIQAAGVGAMFTLGTNTFYRDPILMRDDVSAANDLDVAPFSFYLNAMGSQRIGATTSTYRYSTNIVQGGTIDYSTVDATSTEAIAKYVNAGITITIATGTYRAFTIDDSTILPEITIQGVGAGTIISAGTSEDAITFANVTSSVIQNLTVKNASSTAYSYTLNQSVFTRMGTDYGEAIGFPFDLTANTALVMTDGSMCDFEPYDDGMDVSALVNMDSANWHVALVTLEDTYHETLIIPGGFASNGPGVEALCVGGGPSIAVDYFISDVFVRSGAQMNYSSAAITGASAALKAETPSPGITATGGSRAGIKLTNSGSITIAHVTSTDNGYGVWFADTSSFGNTVTSSVLGDNLSADVLHSASGQNVFQNVTFNRSSTTIDGTGSLLVSFDVRARTVRKTNGAVLSGSYATSTDSAATETALGTTDGSGYTAYTSLLAYRMTSTTSALTGGGYNPYTFTAEKSGYAASSTLATLSSPNQTVTLALISSSLPTAPTGTTVTVIGTTTSTVTWADNSDEEDTYLVDVASLTGGETFPGTTQSVAENGTSVVLTGLTPSQTYVVRVAAVNTNGTSAYSTSTSFTTLPAAPTAPDLHGMSLTSVAITRVNANTNGTSTEYAIYAVTAGTYLDADGAATSTAEWQTTSTWDVLTVTGLTCGTNYSFVTVARNADLVQSATSTVGTVSTLDCEAVASSGGGGGGGGGSLSGPVGPIQTIQPVQPLSPVPPTVPVPPVTTPPPVTPPAVVVEEVPPLPLPGPVNPVKSLDDAARLVNELGISRDMAREERSLTNARKDLAQFGVSATPAQSMRLANFIAYGNSPATIKLGEGERRALIRDALETMKVATLRAEDLDRLARGLPASFRNLPVERAQLLRVRLTFRSLYGHDPDFKKPEEDLAWNTLMYRIRFERNLKSEQQGIVKFKTLFGKNPQEPFQWATVRALGYVKK